ncbi:hypothetical protein, partial [Noviherbaspirillum denitrificans]|uniref:hypothetical protein n=1 Tax=Noviherbaspirillum denitrificans TaxID=1968433 RepID=UPI00197E476B
MNRRKMLHGLATAGLSGAVTACGGGGSSPPVIGSFTSDRSRYSVGDIAILRAVFAGNKARIEPGAIPVVSGVPIQ